MRGSIALAASIIVVLAATGAQAEEARVGERGGLTLAEAIQRAQANLEDFALADEELERARLARDRAWAAVVPAVTATGTYTHADREIAVNDRVLQRQDSLSGNIAASLVVVQGSAVSGVLRAHHAAEAAEHATRWTRNELAYEVARAYFSALASENLVRAAERTRATAEEHLAAVRARRAAGAAVGVDEERARLELISAEEGGIRARNAAASSNDYLAYLIGQEPPVALAPPAVPPGELPTEGALEAGGPRPDQRAAAAEVEAARDALTQAWLRYLPTLTLSGSFRMTQNTGWSGDPYSWQLLLTLDWVIFDGGLRRADRREQASQLRSSQLRQQQLDRQVSREVRQARRDLETALATLRTTSQRLELARQTRERVLRGYRQGVTDSLELVDADDALSQAEVDAVAQELEVSLAWLDLYHALGRDPLGEEIAR